MSDPTNSLAKQSEHQGRGTESCDSVRNSSFPFTKPEGYIALVPKPNPDFNLEGNSTEVYEC
jgi:hypothetical protein